MHRAGNRPFIVVIVALVAVVSAIGGLVQAPTALGDGSAYHPAVGDSARATLTPPTAEPLARAESQGAAPASLSGGSSSSELPPLTNVTLGLSIAASLYDPLNGYVYEVAGRYISPTPGYLFAIDPATDSIAAQIPVGTTPFAVALDPSSGTLYVANGLSNNVSIIDGTTNTVMGSAAAGDSPDGVAYDPVTGDVYVANELSSNVSIINASTGHSLGVNIPVGSEPYAIAYDSVNGLLYTANYGSDTLSVVNATLGIVVGTIGVGMEPYFITAVAENGNLYVLNNASGTVSVVDGATQSVIATIGVDPYVGSGTSTALPQGAAYDSANGYLYVANFGAGTLSAVNTTTSRTDVYSIGVGGGPDAAAFDPSEDRLYVGGAKSGNVSVYAGADLPGLPGTLPAGDGASVLSYSPTYDETLVVNAGTSSVTILNDLNQSVVVPALALASPPTYATYSTSQNIFYIPTTGSNGSIDEVAASNNTLLSANLSSSGFGDPVVDVATGGLLYAVTGNGTLLSFLLSSGSLLSHGPTNLTAPTAITVDPYLGLVFVTGTNASDSSEQMVDILSESTGVALANFTLQLGVQLTSIAYDPLTGDVYVPTYTGLEVFQGTSEVQSISIGDYVGTGVVVDLSTGLLYVAFAGPAKVVAVDPTLGVALTPAIATGGSGAGISYDPLTQVLYVALVGLNEVSLVSADHYVLSFAFTNIPADGEWGFTIGTEFTVLHASPFLWLTENGTVDYSVLPPEGWLAEPSGGELTVLGAGQNVTVAFVTPYTVVFDEAGLPAGTNWSVAINGTTYASSNDSLTVVLPNGTYTYAVIPVPGYTTVYSGLFTVNGSAPMIDVAFSVFHFSTTFTETGLPLGTFWSLTVGNVSANSTGETIMVPVANGSYGYTIEAPVGYTPNPASGNFDVSGSSVNLEISFTPTPPPTYAVTITESGLAAGTSWSAAVNGHQETTGTTSLAFQQTNGTFPWSVTAPPGYSANTSGGMVEVSGAPVSLFVGFTPSGPGLYAVNFTESGLPAGLTWSVIFDGTNSSGNGSSVVFETGNGTYAWSVPAVSGYRGVPASGNVTVYGGSQSIAIAFTNRPPVTYTATFAESGLPTGLSWSVTYDGLTHTTTSGTLVFVTANGTFTYSISAAQADYVVFAPIGAVAVTGANVTVEAVFAFAYAVTFTQSGLPSGTSWSVAVTGFPTGVGDLVTAIYTSSSGSLTFYLPNGTYTYTLSAARSGWEPGEPSGGIAVDGSSPTPVSASFVHGYLLVIQEVGLPTGTSWQATVNGTTYTSSIAFVTVYLANGSYTITFASTGGYVPLDPTYPVTVHGQGASASMLYAVPGASGGSSSTVAFFGIAWWVWAIISAAIIAGAIAGALVLERRRGRPARPPEPEAPSPPAP